MERGVTEALFAIPADETRTALEAVLPAERLRLQRLFMQLTQNAEAAEELTQRTLIAGWRNIHKIHDPSGCKAWLSAIARHIYRRWCREQGRSAFPLSEIEVSSHHTNILLTADSSGDILEELERNELVDLLDRALAQLSPETRSILLARYREETPHAEIAARLGTSEGAVRVQLYRGKKALRQILTTTLRAEAIACGWIQPEIEVWQQTSLWCPYCGQNRLLAQNVRETGGLSLQCPHCSKEKRYFTRSFLPDVLAGTASCRVALKRLMLWADGYYRNGYRIGRTPCVYCGGSTPIRLKSATPDRHLIDASCRTCGATNFADLRFVFLSLPAARRFWQEQSRIYIGPIQKTQVARRASFHACIQDMTSSSKLEIVLACDTLEEQQ